ncbi:MULTISPECIES: DMT family transporter [unclassified Uliginosibacterium]|jgi:drug/metabolite transporter (DMT)-like permease|uniref:DMT family transporter n=1 Tax=unclassified Uliginosibacterium TaxID=2621521 RepID=UPI000C7D41F6|nr:MULTISPECIES: DMT family transporter [unclassified Uliginosibacterium]MDO6386515.1 DMT family transporter [Uliginosibacterium sp. 31-12]PLK50352.1 EamA family transporter [Uliginosibacterium sp. TH139]
MNALWMLLTCFLFATMGACVKSVGSHFNIGQIVGVRGLVPALILGAWVLWQQRSLYSVHWKSHLYRSTAGTLSMLLYFLAITHLPLATAVTLNNTSALFLAGILSFRQPPPRAVFGALALGFAGVVLVLQPSFAQEQWVGAAYGLASAFLTCVAQLNLRELGRAGEPEWRTVCIFSLTTALLALPVALWLSSSATQASELEWGYLIAVGLCGGLGQLTLSRAFGRGRAIVTASVGYSTVIFSSLYGTLLWGDRISLLSILGIAMIIVASLISTHPAVWRGHKAEHAD